MGDHTDVFFGTIVGFCGLAVILALLAMCLVRERAQRRVLLQSLQTAVGCRAGCASTIVVMPPDSSRRSEGCTDKGFWFSVVSLGYVYLIDPYA